jgi:hypothetical protein
VKQQSQDEGGAGGDDSQLGELPGLVGAAHMLTCCRGGHAASDGSDGKGAVMKVYYDTWHPLVALCRCAPRQHVAPGTYHAELVPAMKAAVQAAYVQRCLLIDLMLAAAAAAGINLGLAYQRCAQKGQARSKVRREQALSKLSMPDGRWPVFGRAARKQIPAAVIDRIRWEVVAAVAVPGRCWKVQCAAASCKQ